MLDHKPRALWQPSLLVLAFLGAPSLAFAQNTIGAQRCKECHPFEYEVWAQGPHQKANLALSKEELSDSKCRNCHTDPGRQASEPAVGVDCERCHGPGKYYYPRYVMKDRELARAVGFVEANAAHCMQCHTEGAPSIRPFDFKAMWAKIDHGKKAREAWEKAHGTQMSPATAPAQAVSPVKPAAGTAPTQAATSTKPAAHGEKPAVSNKKPSGG